MEPTETEWGEQERGLELLKGVEELLGEDRFGGAWFDKSISPNVLGIGIVDPTQADVEAIVAKARALDWTVQIVSVRYSRKALMYLLRAANGDPHRPMSEAWLTLGWDASSNSVWVELNRWDEEAVSWSRNRFPSDALRITVRPGRTLGGVLGSGVAWRAPFKLSEPDIAHRVRRVNGPSIRAL